MAENIKNTKTEENVNSLANVWLVLIAAIVGIAVLVTSVLIGWPLIAFLTGSFLG